MKKLNITLTSLALLTMISCGNDHKKEETPVTPTDSSTAVTTPTTETQAAPMDSAAMMKAWQEYMTPNDNHKWMASVDGKWDAEMVFWMAPDAPASQPTKVKVDNRMILGGRYQESEYKGKMDGMDFEGHGTMAYDNAKQKFVSTWIDNMGTGIMVMEGTYDDATKTLSMAGECIDPMTRQKKTMRQVMKVGDPKNQVMEMYDVQNGKEYKSMEIKLTKK